MPAADSPPPRRVRVTGVVLAGGASRRMGADKATLTLGGEPLVVRTIRRIAPVCDRVVVASGTTRRLLPAATTVADPAPGAGPLGGIVAGLGASGDLCAVVGVDLPFASARVLRLLLDRWAGEDAVVPLVAGRLQPLHAVYAPSALRALAARLRAGERSVNRALGDLVVRRVGAADWALLDAGGWFAANLNRPADRARLLLLQQQR